MLAVLAGRGREIANRASHSFLRFIHNLRFFDSSFTISHSLSNIFPVNKSSAEKLEMISFPLPQVWDPQGDRQGLVWAGAQGVRPQDPPTRGPQDGEKREEVPSASPGGDQDPRAPEEAGQGQHLQYHPHVRQLLIQVRLIDIVQQCWPQVNVIFGKCIFDILVFNKNVDFDERGRAEHLLWGTMLTFSICKANRRRGAFQRLFIVENCSV